MVQRACRVRDGCCFYAQSSYLHNVAGQVHVRTQIPAQNHLPMVATALKVSAEIQLSSGYILIVELLLREIESISVKPDMLESHLWAAHTPKRRHCATQRSSKNRTSSILGRLIGTLPSGRTLQTHMHATHRCSPDSLCSVVQSNRGRLGWSLAQEPGLRLLLWGCGAPGSEAGCTRPRRRRCGWSPSP